MFGDCIIKITCEDETVLIDQTYDGHPDYAGAIVALAARNILEGKIQKTDMNSVLDFFLTECINWDFDVIDEAYQVEFFYHLDITKNGNVIIGYGKPELINCQNFSLLAITLKRFKVKTFIEKLVNPFRKKTNAMLAFMIRSRQIRDNNPHPYGERLPMLRLPQSE